MNEDGPENGHAEINQDHDARDKSGLVALADPPEVPEEVHGQPTSPTGADPAAAPTIVCSAIVLPTAPGNPVGMPLVPYRARLLAAGLEYPRVNQGVRQVDHQIGEDDGDSYKDETTHHQ